MVYNYADDASAAITCLHSFISAVRVAHKQAAGTYTHNNNNNISIWNILSSEHSQQTLWRLLFRIFPRRGPNFLTL